MPILSLNPGLISSRNPAFKILQSKNSSLLEIKSSVSQHVEKPSGSGTLTPKVVSHAHFEIFYHNQTDSFNSAGLHITIELPSTFGLATTLVHPSTYLNRIVVASQEGQLAIYNIQTGALIHIFQPTLFTTPFKARCSSAKIPITRMVQAPAVDIIAVGFADGWCSLVDVRFGEEILAVKMGQSDSSHSTNSGVLDAVNGIAFRSGKSER